MPRITHIKCPPEPSQYGPVAEVGSKSIEWLARLTRAFRAC